MFYFDEKRAEKFGTDEAIMLFHILWWIFRNKDAGEDTYRDGAWWMFQPQEEMAERLPFWSRNQVRRVLDSLISQGVIKTGRYNKKGYDRKKWYRVSDAIFKDWERRGPKKPRRAIGANPPMEAA